MPPRRNQGRNLDDRREDTPPPPPQPEMRIEERFLRHNPPGFSGTGNLQEAEDWARQKTLTPEQIENYTWEQFKATLFEKYIPRSYRKQREAEFGSLRQGKKSVAEYDREFCDLSRFAPQKVDTDEKMSELFCAGLRQDIRVVLASQAALPYTEALNRALDMELAMHPEKVLQAPALPLTQTKMPGGQQTAPPAQSGKRKWEDRGQGNRKPWQGQGQQQQGKQQYPGQSSGQPRTPPCAKCNKMHLGVCKAGSNSCYNCGQAGHYSSHCPNKQQGMARGKLEQSSAQPLRAIMGYPQPPQQQRQPQGPQKQ
ncbi:uncharacterized protein LOC130990724 [Salvia miltiorrhiza]|uniref:uncharacterized protein LOC130990724 n=1 Tax=Salvia miltiorrhiza TaxID=226208 RepID=UPI0025ABA671|nr:uncharacterized protein LOC130990724 [Salvia miltiorrhiza]